MQSNKKEDSYLFKYNVGYTTGTFDLFHVGHLNLLERAKQQCEYLVVGVSTDALVAEYKGRAPIIPFEDRIRIIAALKCVDGVIPQESMIKLSYGIKFILMFYFMGMTGKTHHCIMKLKDNYKRRG